MQIDTITVRGAFEHNLKGIDVDIPRNAITVITGVSGSGKSSLAFDTILAEAQRRFFYTLSHYSRQFLDLGSRPAVRQVTGLSPAISLAQNETMPSRRATVATLSDIGELIGVLLARFGEQSCPTHGLPTESQDEHQIVARLRENFSSQVVAVCAPIATQKKGQFRKKLESYAQNGYAKAFIDGKLVPLEPTPILEREEKHTIKLVVDTIRVNDKATPRLHRSIVTATDLSSGVAEVIAFNERKQLDLNSLQRVSTQAGCPSCGYSWPKLDSRYFSPNSLGQCKACRGYGTSDVIDEDDTSNPGKNELEFRRQDCPSCLGCGIDANWHAIKFSETSVQKMLSASISSLISELKSKPWQENRNAACKRVLDELLAQLERIEGVGLGYLQLQRRVRSLSAGEAQRLRLAGILGENLRGVLYVLDEPSQGLHPSEVQKLCASLRNLQKQGNTILIVDHDEGIIRFADQVIDLGPGGGRDGGELVAQFAPKMASSFVNKSATAKRLCGASLVVSELSNQLASKKLKDTISLKNCVLNNLNIKKVDFPIGKLSVIMGVSGAGKTSLVIHTLYQNAYERMLENPHSPRKTRRNNTPVAFGCEQVQGLEAFSKVWLVDRKPIAKSSVSMPATYLDIYQELRALYAKHPDAQIAGFTARDFSLHAEGGRCDECRGRGDITVSMRFLADAKTRCPVCHGKRFKEPILDVKYKGLNLNDVLELTLDEAYKHFSSHKKIVKRLEPAITLGLGYLKLGQPSSSLSGGEAQRLKLVPFLSKTHGSESLIIIDEPTTGLHHEDTVKLCHALVNLRDLGATVIVIEHNLELLRIADWLLEIGPGAASLGGQLVFSGPPADLVKVKTITSAYLASH